MRILIASIGSWLLYLLGLAAEQLPKLQALSLILAIVVSFIAIASGMWKFYNFTQRMIQKISKNGK